MAIVEIRMGMEQNEGTESYLGVWHKKPGEAVKAYQPVADITTDKAALELVAPQDGVLCEILKKEGEPVAPGELLARMETDVIVPPELGVPQRWEAPGSSPQSPARAELIPPASGPLELSPGVRRLIAEHGLDAAKIPSATPGARLTIRDVEVYLEAHRPPAKKPSRLLPHTPMRRTIANHLAKSLLGAPHVTSVFEADFSRVLADRAARKAVAQSADEVPTLTAYLVLAAVKALQSIPEANSRWRDEGLEIFEDINLGFGAATPDGGLIVPVIHRAQDLDVMQISARLRALTVKAREGRLSRSELENGTFTLSNHGVGGSLLAAPIIINQAQAAILGAGKLQKRAIVNPATDAIEVKPMMYITLTIDHRVLDGQQTDALLTRLVQVLEHEI